MTHSRFLGRSAIHVDIATLSLLIRQHEWQSLAGIPSASQTSQHYRHQSALLSCLHGLCACGGGDLVVLFEAGAPSWKSAKATKQAQCLNQKVCQCRPKLTLSKFDCSRTEKYCL